MKCGKRVVDTYDGVERHTQCERPHGHTGVCMTGIENVMEIGTPTHAQCTRCSSRQPTRFRNGAPSIPDGWCLIQVHVFKAGKVTEIRGSALCPDCEHAHDLWIEGDLT